MLQLILGRAGYGKTKKVLEYIISDVSNSDDEIFLITPEQFSFESEKMLINTIGEKNLYRVENTSFSRIGNEVRRIYGNDPYPILSQGSKAVLMKKAIDMVKDNLMLFNKSISKPSFVNSVIKIYDEMKSCRVSADDILKVGESTEKEILSKKLKDISSIMAAYDALIEDKYYDPSEELTRLYEKLLKADYFCNKTVYIDGFNGFVAQEYKIIEIILKQAKRVVITFCSDSCSNNDKYDLFSYVNSNIGILYEVAKKIGVKIEEPIMLEKPYRFSNDELRCVEKYAFSHIDVSEFPNTNDNVKIYKASNISDECENTALEILKLFRKGVRASQIAVICRDYDKYRKELEFSFKKFGIPFFDDERQSVSSQPIIMFVNFLLRCVIYGFRSEDIFSLLKTGMTTLNDIKINQLENYVFMWSINGNKWKNEFFESTKGLVENITEYDKNEIENVEKTRKYVIDKLVKFNKAAKNQTCSGISKAVYYCIKDFKSDVKLKQLALDLQKNGKSALAQEQGRIWDLLMNVLDSLAVLGENEKITVSEYYNLFNLMVSSEDLGSLPTGIDNIQVGSSDRIRCNNPYAVFLLGCNEGVFPQSVSSAGLLSENDRIVLINNDFKLYSYGETLNAQEKYFAYMSACSATDKLYASYISGGDSSEKSLIITGIERCLPNVTTSSFNNELTLDKIESVDNAFDSLVSHYNDNSVLSQSLKHYFKSRDDYSGKVAAVESLINNENITISDTKTATQLFKKDMYLSASKVEDYYKCPFKYFCKFGLKALPRTKVELDPMQTGTVIHFVLEEILKSNPKDSFIRLNDKEISDMVDSALYKYLDNKITGKDSLSSRTKNQFLRLSKMLNFVVIRLRDEFLNSDFTPEAFELKIGNDENDYDVKSVPINLNDGGSITIKGSIDRVDVYKENSKQYIRIVDYKSGTKNFNLSDILYGLNLQMFIYLFSLCNSNHKLSGIGSGVLYMHSARSIHSLESGNVESIKKQLETKNDKNFKMDGVFLDDNENHIIKHMERNINGSGRFVNVKTDKNSNYSGNVLTLEELGAVSRKINRLIVEMGESLHKGQINQNPIKCGSDNFACTYCEYADVCKNRKEIATKDVKKMKKFEFVDELYREEAENAKMDRTAE